MVSCITMEADNHPENNLDLHRVPCTHARRIHSLIGDESAEIKWSSKYYKIEIEAWNHRYLHRSHTNRDLLQAPETI